MLDLAALIAEKLAVTISFKDEGGKDQRLPKAKVLAKRIVNEALKTGNPKHLRDFLPKAVAAANEDYSEADLVLIARALAHLGRGGKPAGKAQAAAA